MDDRGERIKLWLVVLILSTPLQLRGGSNLAALTVVTRGNERELCVSVGALEYFVESVSRTRIGTIKQQALQVYT